MQKITTFLWFDDKAEEAAKFYCSLFAHSKVTEVTRAPEGTPGGAGKVMWVSFELAGQTYHALNGAGPRKFTENFSLFVDCEDQAEVDRLWSKLTADGGEESQCGWLRDKFGVSWQIIPRALSTFMRDKDPAKSARVLQSMMTMRKIDVATLERAYRG
jgi:predicted 3-demethylubiquinone-9 3-methyltransferase (glyoxalase superfamily)